MAIWHTLESFRLPLYGRGQEIVSKFSVCFIKPVSKTSMKVVAVFIFQTHRAQITLTDNFFVFVTRFVTSEHQITGNKCSVGYPY